MSAETTAAGRPEDLSVVFVEPPKWAAPAPEVWDQLKPPKKRQGKRGPK